MRIKKNLIIPYIVAVGIVSFMFTSIVAIVAFLISIIGHFHISGSWYYSGYIIGFIIVLLSGLELIIDVVPQKRG